MLEKNQLKLKHTKEILKLKQEYKKEKRMLNENFEEKMKIIEHNFEKYMSDNRKQNKEILKLLEDFNNLKRKIEIRNIIIKAARENKIVTCDSIKFENHSHKIDNLGFNQKINKEEIKNEKENDEIENGAIVPKKSEDKKGE